jgi:hypothetical protein
MIPELIIIGPLPTFGWVQSSPLLELLETTVSQRTHQESRRI